MYRITSQIIVGLIIVMSLPLSTAQANLAVDEEARAELMELRSQKAKLGAQEKLLRVKTALELRDDQLPAWNDYEAYMLNEQSDRHAMMKDMQQRRLNKQAPPNSVELAEKNIERLERQLENAKQRLAVYAGLYNVLDTEQQQKLDKLANKKVKRMAKNLRKNRRDK